MSLLHYYCATIWVLNCLLSAPMWLIFFKLNVWGLTIALNEAKMWSVLVYNKREGI